MAMIRWLISSNRTYNNKNECKKTENENQSINLPSIIGDKEFLDKDPPDGGVKAWTVMSCSFLCNGIIFGLLTSYASIHVQLKDVYKDSEEKSSLMSSLFIGSLFAVSPISGVLADRYGIRATSFLGSFIATLGALISSFFIHRFDVMCFTFGIMVGTGFSLVYTPSIVILGHYFGKYLGVVNGFVNAASSVFGAVLPHALKFLFRETGTAYTFRILAGLIATLMLASLSFTPLIAKTKISKQKSELINWENWKNRKYAVWTIAGPIALLGYFVPHVHMLGYIEEILPDRNGEAAITSIAIAGGVAKIAYGLLADLPGINPIYLQQLSFIGLGFCTMLLTMTPFFGNYSYESMIAFSLMLGLFTGSYSTLIGPIASKICGPKGASQAIGFNLGLCSIPLMAGPFIAGVMYKWFESYTISFLCAGVPPIIGAIIMCGMYFDNANEREEEHKKDVVRILDMSMLQERATQKDILNDILV